MKLRTRFLQLPVQFDAARLADEVARIPADDWRAHPQGFPGNDALPLVSRDGDPADDATSGPMRPTPQLLSSPCLTQVLGALSATWGRTRLMRLSGQAEVAPHIDTDYYWREHLRVHVPIVTQPTVRFDCGEESVHMAAGECWIFDTWSLHRVINDASRARIHLVADTVGGDGLLSLIEHGRSPAEPRPGWTAREIPFGDGASPPLQFESVNSPEVMTPWELRDHIAFALGEAAPHPRLRTVGALLNRFTVRWHALWARHGADPAARAEYKALLDSAWKDLARLDSPDLLLRNQMPLVGTLSKLVFAMALAQPPTGDAELRNAPVAAPSPRQPPPAATADRASGGRSPADQRFDRPVFIVSAPRSGSTMLFETLAQAPCLFTTGGENHALIEQIAGFNPARRGWDSNRLTADDATPQAVALLRQRLDTTLRDRDGLPPPPGLIRMLEKTPKNALRLPLLGQAFPEARFIYLHREPLHVMASMIDAWASGQFETYPTLPGWRGPPWSLLLVPGWRELDGRPVPEIVAQQWSTTVRIVLDDLSDLDPGRWTITRYDDLVAGPDSEIRRLVDWLGVQWDQPDEVQLNPSVHTLTPPQPDKWRRHQAALDALAPIYGEQAARARALAEERFAA